MNDDNDNDNDDNYEEKMQWYLPNNFMQSGSYCVRYHRNFGD